MLSKLSTAERIIIQSALDIISREIQQVEYECEYEKEDEYYFYFEEQEDEDMTQQEFDSLLEVTEYHITSNADTSKTNIITY